MVHLWILLIGYFVIFGHCLAKRVQLPPFSSFTVVQCCPVCSCLWKTMLSIVGLVLSVVSFPAQWAFYWKKKVNLVVCICVFYLHRNFWCWPLFCVALFCLFLLWKTDCLEWTQHWVNVTMVSAKPQRDLTDISMDQSNGSFIS